MAMVNSSPVGDHASFEPIPSSPLGIAFFGVLVFDRALSSSSDKCSRIDFLAGICLSTASRSVALQPSPK
jgi:hypothetical protein